MEAAGSQAEGAVLEVLAEVTDILEPVGLQEEAELPAQMLAEFERNSRKKDKLLCSQLQVADFLQNFLAKKDTAQGLDPLASEDTSRQKAVEAKEQWKELKATYQDQVEVIRNSVTQAVTQLEEAQRKRTQLQQALEQLQVKKRVAMEKLQTAQKQWQLQQAKHLQHLAEVSKEIREQKTGTQQELEQLSQELGNLKQQAALVQDQLQRHQNFLQLLFTLQGKVPCPEADTQAKAKAELPAELPVYLNFLGNTMEKEDSRGADMLSLMEGREECLCSWLDVVQMVVEFLALC